MDICKRIPVIPVFVFFFFRQKDLKSVFIYWYVYCRYYSYFQMSNTYCKVCYWVIFNKSHAFNTKNKKLFFAKHLYHKT